MTSEYYYDVSANEVVKAKDIPADADMNDYVQTEKITDKNLRQHIDLEDKLENMLWSGITESVYEYITGNNIRMTKLENTIAALYPVFAKNYDIAFDTQLYDCDAIYMTAINIAFHNNVVPCNEGYGDIKMVFESKD